MPIHEDLTRIRYQLLHMCIETHEENNYRATKPLADKSASYIAMVKQGGVGRNILPNVRNQ